MFILGHRSTYCTVSAGGGSKREVATVTGGGTMKEDSMIVEDGVSEVMKEDGRKSPFEVHADVHMVESSSSVEEGEAESNLYRSWLVATTKPRREKGLSTGAPNRAVS